MEFRDFFVMALIVGLAIFCLISGSYYYSQQNGASLTILNQTSINKMYGNIERQLNESQEVSDAKREALVEETGNTDTTSIFGFAFKSILSAGTTFIGSVISMFEYIFIFAKETFMISSVVLGTIMAIIIGLLVLGAWSLWRAGR